MTWLNRHRLYFVLVIFLGSNLLGCGESPSGTGTGTAESVETAALFSSRLQLSATTPADGATNVSTSSALTATFNRPVNPATVTGTTFTLTKNGETLRVTGIITTSDVTATFALPPGILLASDTLYTATVTRGIKD